MLFVKKWQFYGHPACYRERRTWLCQGRTQALTAARQVNVSTRSANSQQNLMEWTFDEAPNAKESGSAGRQSPTPGQSGRGRLATGSRRAANRAVLLVGVLAALAVALSMLLPQVEAWRTRRDIEAVVLRQEQALIAGDRAALHATFKNPGDLSIDDLVRRLKSGWQPAAFGLPGAQWDGQPGTIHAFQVLSAGLVRADVARTYVLADGTRATFAMPQYYQFTAGAWQQVPAPPSPTNDIESLSRDRLYVHYNPADMDFAARTAGELETPLRRACVDWGCPPEVQVAAVFTRPDPALASAPVSSLAGSLTFEMLVAGQTTLPDLVAKLPTQAWAGYPADPAAEAAVRRSVAVQALANVAERLTGGTPGLGGPIRPLLYAVEVRELVRLGLEPPELSEMRSIEAGVDADQLWSLPAAGPDSPPVLLCALAVVNRLMAGRSPADERNLLLALGQASDPAGWLEVGLGLTPVQAQAEWVSLTAAE